MGGESEVFTTRESQGPGKGGVVGVVGSLRGPGSVGPGVILAVFSTRGLLVLLCARHGVDGLLEPNCDGPIGRFRGRDPSTPPATAPIGERPTDCEFVGMDVPQRRMGVESSKNQQQQQQQQQVLIPHDSLAAFFGT